MGATGMNCQGRKYRWVSTGQKNSMPRPPVVMASSTPWLATTKVARSASVSTGRRRTASPSATRRPTAAANSSECVIPRWPYGFE